MTQRVSDEGNDAVKSETVSPAREWLKSKNLGMLLGSHIGASGNYLCELLDEFASHVSRLSSQAIASAAKEAAEGIWDADWGENKEDFLKTSLPIISAAIEKARSK